MGNIGFKKFREKVAERWMHLTEIIILVGFGMWLHSSEHRSWQNAALLACVAIGSTIVAIIVWPKDK